MEWVWNATGSRRSDPMNISGKFGGRIMRMATSMALSSVVTGCTSVEVTGRAGRPVVWGLGWAGPVAGTGGKVHRVVAPGLSLRVHGAAPGASVGWHETLLFFPDGGGSEAGGSGRDRPVAVSRRVYGLNLSPSAVVLGSDRVFAVSRPEPGVNLRQTVFFRANQVSNTIVEYQEFP